MCLLLALVSGGELFAWQCSAYGINCLQKYNEIL